jgi:hypothetical protein
LWFLPSWRLGVPSPNQFPENKKINTLKIEHTIWIENGQAIIIAEEGNKKVIKKYKSFI